MQTHGTSHWLGASNFAWRLLGQGKGSYQRIGADARDL